MRKLGHARPASSSSRPNGSSRAAPAHLLRPRNLVYLGADDRGLGHARRRSCSRAPTRSSRSCAADASRTACCDRRGGQPAAHPHHQPAPGRADASRSRSLSPAERHAGRERVAHRRRAANRSSTVNAVTTVPRSRVRRRSGHGALPRHLRPRLPQGESSSCCSVRSATGGQPVKLLRLISDYRWPIYIGGHLTMSVVACGVLVWVATRPDAPRPDPGLLRGGASRGTPTKPSWTPAGSSAGRCATTLPTDVPHYRGHAAARGRDGRRPRRASGDGLDRPAVRGAAVGRAPEPARRRSSRCRSRRRQLPDARARRRARRLGISPRRDAGRPCGSCTPPE